jgi:hypothetical protein
MLIGVLPATLAPVDVQIARISGFIGPFLKA